MPSESRKHQRIFLYGPPGSGKTTAGKILAERLGLPFDDLDSLIERDAGSSIAQLFEAEGEAGFRQREARRLRTWIEERVGVLALGGGALLDPAGRAAAEGSGLVVCLTAPPSELLPRLEKQAGLRPLLAAGEMSARLENLLRARAGHYGSFAAVIQTGGCAPEEIADQVQRAAGWFRLPDHEQGYDVRVVCDGLDDLKSLLGLEDFSGKIGLVSDANVMPLYGERMAAGLEAAGLRTASFLLPAGEAFKTMETVTQLWEGFLKSGLDRGSLILSVGGGVVSDIAGFAAGTFMRGVRWAAVPTSLLAMVDAALGGKTGVDLPFGKNLVGSFHPPVKVLSDPSVLSTLPVDEWRCGLAETVKHAVLSDAGLFDECRKLGHYNPHYLDYGLEGWSELVKRSTAVKVKFVTQDPFEKGVRAALNLGHTIGHAVELVSQFTIKHGEAVSIGMVLEARLAEKLSLAQAGLADEIADVLAGLGLPVGLPRQIDVDAVGAAIEHDKKRHNGKVRFALPVCIGCYELVYPPVEKIREVLKGEA